MSLESEILALAEKIKAAQVPSEPKQKVKITFRERVDRHKALLLKPKNKY